MQLEDISIHLVHTSWISFVYNYNIGDIRNHFFHDPIKLFILKHKPL